MRLSDIAKLSTRMFKTNPSRTWLTILGMGVGTAAVVILVGLGFGLQGIILEQIVFGETLLSLTVSGPAVEAVTLDDEALSEFLALPNVLDVAPVASFPALLTFEDLSANIILEAIPTSFVRYAGITTSVGDTFSDDTAAEDDNSVMISGSTLQLFGIEDPEDVIGGRVRFRVLVPRIDDPSSSTEMPIDKFYTIKGVTQEEGAPKAYMTLPELEQYVSITRYDRTQVRVDASDNLDLVQDEIVAMGFNVIALSSTVEQATKIFQGIQAVLGTFGGIALIVSAIGMFNTMTVTLLERTGEIGIMRTLGAAPIDIKILFLAEAVIVGFLGGIVGILIGMGTGFGLNGLLNFVAGRAGGVSVSLFRFPIGFLLFIASFSAIVGFMTGVFPARRAAGLNPLDAIRYK